MKIALILHLYQPYFQESSVIKDIAENSYIPLIKFIKKRRHIKFTLNIPLSLFVLMEKAGYKTWIDDIKELHNQGRIELTGSGAYHPLLTKIPLRFSEQQIILNEYGLGYFLGSKTGFEGENAILIKEVTGFFPPELAINTLIHNQLMQLGYRWFLVDETAIPILHCGSVVYEVLDNTTKVICRNRILSNILAFTRDSNEVSFIDALNDYKSDSIVIALDGETFGHHNKQGFELLDNILDNPFIEENSICTVTELIEDIEVSTKIETILESTWGATDKDMTNGVIYPMWHSPDSKLHNIQWDLLNKILTSFPDTTNLKIEGFENSPIWQEEIYNDISDNVLKDALVSSIVILKLCNSDQFWWASNKTLPTGNVLYDPNIVIKSADLIYDFVNTYYPETIKKEIMQLISELKNILVLN